MNRSLSGLRVFVTGGAGFIGSRLVGRLLGAGAQCWVYDSLHEQVHGVLARPPELGAGVSLTVADIADGASLAAALNSAAPHLVYHLAAETGTGQSSDEPARYCRANVLGTALLIEAVRSLPAPPHAVILASSRAIYGEGEYRTSSGKLVTPGARSPALMSAGEFVPEAPGEGIIVPVATREEACAAPASVYASTKLMQEHLLLQTGADAPWRRTILRFQNVYGPGQSLLNPYTGVLSIFTNILAEGGELDIYEDGQIVRDFVYVDDVVGALLKAAEVADAELIANIGSGHPTTILEAAYELARLTGRPAAAVRISGRFRPGDIRHALADIQRAARSLDWRPSTDFATGARALVKWALSPTQG